MNCFEHVCPCILICRSLSHCKCNNDKRKSSSTKHKYTRAKCDSTSMRFVGRISVRNPSFCHVIHSENEIIFAATFSAFTLIGFLLVARVAFAEFDRMQSEWEMLSVFNYMKSFGQLVSTEELRFLFSPFILFHVAHRIYCKMEKLLLPLHFSLRAITFIAKHISA